MTSPDELRERVVAAFSRIEDEECRTEAAGSFLDAVMAVVTPELERRDAMYEAAERQYAEVTGGLRADLDRYKAAHESTQRGLIRMEQQRDANGVRATEEFAARQEALADLAAAENASDYTFSALADRLEDLGLARPEGLAHALDQTKWAMDVLAWLHAEAVWQRDAIAVNLGLPNGTSPDWVARWAANTIRIIHIQKTELDALRAQLAEARTAAMRECLLMFERVLGDYVDDNGDLAADCFDDVMDLARTWASEGGALVSKSVPAIPDEDEALFAVALDRVRRDKGARHTLDDVMREMDALDDPSPEASSEAGIKEPSSVTSPKVASNPTPPSAGEADTTLRVWKDLRGCEWEEVPPLDELRLIRTDPSHCREVDGPTFWRRYVEAHYGPLVEVLPNTEQEASQ